MRLGGRGPHVCGPYAGHRHRRAVHRLAAIIPVVAGLSYLSVLRLGGDAYMGGLMTVNELGLPTEFVYSEPLTPSKLQVSLYGSALGRYVMVDLIGKGLLDASQARGAPTLVGQGDLLPLATRVKRPLCQLTLTTLRPLNEVGQVKENSPEEHVVQLSEVYSPYLLRIYDRVNFPVAQHLPALMECAARFDILEPFNRVTRTLELIRDGATA